MSLVTCDQISGELVAFLDGELGEEVRRPIATHVSTCLACRHEVERLTTVRRWVGGVATIEPSPEFTTEFWRRLKDEPMRAVPRWPSARALRWIAPVLAVAAVVAVAFQFMTRTPDRPTPKADQRVVNALAVPAVKAKLATAPEAKDAARQLATIADLKPEDLPPALLEHPELFLRLPVVRRLETLEHFEAVRQEHGDDDGAG